MPAQIQPISFPETLARKKFSNHNFSGRDLSKHDLSYSLFHFCNFDRANLTEADCTGSDFLGSSFVDSICYRTNFKDARLMGTVFRPKEAFGITVTLQCDTFRGMQVSQLWWYGWLTLLTMTVPEGRPAQESVKDRLVGLIGAERYLRLKIMFRRREL